jgi:hypothetical protein
MDQEEKDRGTIAALMIKFTEYRLPRVERMLEDVRAGEKLTDIDIDYLELIYNEGKSNRALWQRHPEYNTILTKFTDLYLEIVRLGLENEKSAD